MIPAKLSDLHAHEEVLRAQARELIANDHQLTLHLTIVEHAMDLAYLFRRIPTDDEDMNVLQILGMRVFNALAATTKLALSGYIQNSVLVMRDIQETVFLLDFFKGDPAAIGRWRHAGTKERIKSFTPLLIRVALDTRDGFTEQKRFARYGMFSELAGHPTMKSAYLMRPEKDGDTVIGPFMNATVLGAVLSEIGRLAVQVGELINAFLADFGDHGSEERLAFKRVKLQWIEEFAG